MSELQSWSALPMTFGPEFVAAVAVMFLRHGMKRLSLTLRGKSVQSLLRMGVKHCSSWLTDWTNRLFSSLWTWPIFNRWIIELNGPSKLHSYYVKTTRKMVVYWKEFFLDSDTFLNRKHKGNFAGYLRVNMFQNNSQYIGIHFIYHISNNPKYNSIISYNHQPNISYKLSSPYDYLMVKAL